MWWDPLALSLTRSRLVYRFGFGDRPDPQKMAGTTRHVSLWDPATRHLDHLERPRLRQVLRL